MYIQRPKGAQPRRSEADERVLLVLLRSQGNEKECGGSSPDSLELDKHRFSHPHPHRDGATAWLPSLPRGQAFSAVGKP